jgi:hypothetical protein
MDIPAFHVFPVFPATPPGNPLIAQCLRRFASRISRLLPAAILMMLPLCAAHAQFNASLRGTVTDPTGAVIPGATVTLTNKSTGAKQQAISNGGGIYTFNGLAPAPYSIKVVRNGFQSKVLQNVQIIPEQANTLDLQMQVGKAQQTVTVSGTALGLPTSTATLSSTISSQQIQHMPSFNRDVFQLAQLTPGTFGDASQASGGGSFELPGNQGPGGPGGTTSGIFQTENGPQVQDMGGQYETNSISVDGISTVSAVWGGTSIITPSEDSVQSVHVVSNSYNAEVGRFSGAQIQVTTKSGTNQIHGSAFFKASRPGLNAYQRWNGPGSVGSGTPQSRGLNRDDNRFNNYGGSLGGPLWKNHLFAFFNVETSPLSASTTSQNWYETSQFDSSAPSGSIASQYLSHKGEGVASAGMVSETCADIGLVEGKNCNTESGGLDIGSPLKSPLGTQDLTYGGSSDDPGVGGGLDGIPDLAYFTTVDPTTISQTQYNGRLDDDLTQKDHLTFALYWVPVDQTTYEGPVRSANLWHHSQVNNAFSLIWNHIFSATLLNQARVNAAGWRWNELATNPQEPFGLPQDNIENLGTASMSNSYFGAPGPTDLDQWTYDYNDVLTKIIGRHNIKAGGDLTRLYYLNNALYAARPSFTFANLWDFDNDAPNGESGFFNHSTGIPFSNREDNRLNVWGFFGQDDWKLSPDLTINLGLRWSYFGGYYSKENNLDVMQFGPGPDPLTGLNIRVGGHLAAPQKSNWGPQFGFAWQPPVNHHKAVLRGGFGIDYNQDEIAILANGFPNPPNGVNISYTCNYPYTTDPTCSGTGILYETAININSIFGYAPNPSTITAFSSANLPLTGTAKVVGYPSKLKTIAEYHYSLETDYELPYDSVATLSYEGSQTRHLIIQDEWNAIAAAKGLALNPVVKNIDYYENSGNANYNSMIATLTHNFVHGLQASAQYTWGKAMDENSGPYSEDLYPYDVHEAYGRSDYDVQNAFKLFGMWQPVLFHGNHMLDKIAGGWSFSGIWNWHTGFPWNPLFNTVSNTYYQGSPYSQLRPAAYIGGAGISTSNNTFEGPNGSNPNYKGNGVAYFTPPTYVVGAAFPATSPAPAPGIHRNSLNGPRYNDLDGSLAKTFGLPKMPVFGENAGFEFRLDDYNVFNKTNLDPASIDNTIATVNADGTTTTPNSDFGRAKSALGSRTIQLQVRFSF